MKIGILKCDTVDSALMKHSGDYGDMFKKFLTIHNRNIQINIYDVVSKEYPKTISENDAYLITGSKRSVYEEEEWIKTLAAFVKILHQKKIKTIGICFGHQLLAHFLGGKTERSKKGWGLGIQEIKIIKRAPWMEPYRKKVSLIFSHQDQVVILPKGAEQLGTNEHCPNAIFRLEDHILSIQPHPEFNEEYFKGLAKKRKGTISEEKLEKAFESFKTQKPDSELISKWIVRFIEG